jgi:hypothetical protein
MRALSVADQDAAIRRLFPAFRLTCPFDFMGIWRGPLRPLARTYEIGIAYFPRVHFAGALIANPWITVEVLSPAIGLDPRGTGEKPPHIYRRPGSASGWSLCLFDPRTEDWEPHRHIVIAVGTCCKQSWTAWTDGCSRGPMSAAGGSRHGAAG